MANIERKPFGVLKDGRKGDLFILTNANGMKAAFTNYGASVVGITAPDRAGHWKDVVLGYESIEEYEKNDRCAGAGCGRVAARLGGGDFYLNGKKYHTSKNEDGVNTLHGGFCGFDRKLWNADIIHGQLVFTYISPDGEEGFPGCLAVKIFCQLTDSNEILFTYLARSSEDTIVNLTNHIYFNLKGHGEGTVENHSLWVDSDYYAPCCGNPMPDGQILQVKGTPVDFRVPSRIGDCLNSGFGQISALKGLNHDFFINKNERGNFSRAAALYEEESGRVMEVFTTKPAIHLFTANNLTERRGKGGKSYRVHSGFCLEPGYAANSMQFLHFPSPVLRKGEEYCHKTAFRFGAISSGFEEWLFGRH